MSMPAFHPGRLSRRLCPRRRRRLNDLPAGVGLRFIDTPLRAAILANELRRSGQVGAA
jgi:hypothetical protein